MAGLSAKPRLYSVAGAAAAAGVSRQLLSKLIGQGSALVDKIDVIGAKGKPVYYVVTQEVVDAIRARRKND